METRGVAPPTQPFSSSSRPTRSRISPAALFVKVTARIDSGLTPCLRMSHVMRLTTTLVLPLPAPATIARGPSVCSTASRCCGFRESRNVIP